MGTLPIMLCPQEEKTHENTLQCPGDSDLCPVGGPCTDHRPGDGCRIDTVAFYGPGKNRIQFFISRGLSETLHPYCRACKLAAPVEQFCHYSSDRADPGGKVRYHFHGDHDYDYRPGDGASERTAFHHRAPRCQRCRLHDDPACLFYQYPERGDPPDLHSDPDPLPGPGADQLGPGKPDLRIRPYRGGSLRKYVRISPPEKMKGIKPWGKPLPHQTA